MSLQPRAKSHVLQLAKKGDLTHQAIAYAMGGEAAIGTPQVVVVTDPATKAANDVAVTWYGDAATNPGLVAAGAAAIFAAAPRNVRATFGAAWDGGDIVVTGTDQFDKAATETLTASQGGVVVGVKIFKTITALAKTAVGVGTHGTNTVTVGSGDKLACGTKKLGSIFGQLSVDGVMEVVAFDATVSAFTPTTAPNGAHDYTLLVYATSGAL